MKAIGVGVGIPFGRSRGWNPLKPLGGELPTLWATKRSGSYLQDSEGNNIAEIHSSHITSSIKYRADATLFDIGLTDFTIAVWLEDTSVSDAQRNAFGKTTNGTQPQGMYGFLTGANGLLYAQCKTTEMTVSIPTAAKARTLGKVFALFEINQTTKVCKFFINNVQVGVDTAFTGTFPAVDAKYEFVIGAGNVITTGTGYTVAWTGHISDGYIFRKILTPTEKTTLYNRGIVLGALAHYPLQYPYDNSDFSGNGYTLTGSGAQTYAYSIMGSMQPLNAGYDLYTKVANYSINVPYTDAGVAIAASYSDYDKYGSFAGNDLTHNGARSLIVFDNAFFDRSDATIYSDRARTATPSVNDFYSFYSAATPKRWFIDELCDEAFGLFFNADYKNKLFVLGNNPWDTDKDLREIILYDTQKTGSNLTKVLKYVKLPYSRSGICITLDDTARLDTWVTSDYKFKFKYKWKFTGSLNLVNDAAATAVKARTDAMILHLHMFANHTVNHPNGDDYIAANGEQAYYDNELLPCQTRINNILLIPQKVYHHAYMNTNPPVLNALLLNGGFTQIRRPNPNPTTSPTFYDGLSQVIFSNGSDYMTIEQTLSAIAQAKTTNKIIMIGLHSIGDVTDFNTLTLSYSYLETILQYITNNGMKFYTTDELLPTLFT